MDDRARLAEIFEEMAVFLDLNGENVFKVRTFQNAARFLGTSPMTLDEIIGAPPKGFGKSLIEKVEEFKNSGSVAQLDELRSSVPSGVLDLLRVQGLGPKKVRILFEEEKITSLDQLEKACRENRIQGLKGFGEKSQENILQGISFLKRFKGQFLYSQAEQAAREMIEFLHEKGGDIPIVPAGSLRRCKETVRDIDILAATDGHEALIARFLEFPGIEKVLASGDTKSSVLLGNGLQVDLRVVPPDSFGPALCHFTGSKEHNTRMRVLAIEQGMKLNEYGLYKDEKAPPMATEEEVFQALGLEFIPPELREGLDEIEWARNRTLPKLVEIGNLVGTLHCHTRASDGSGTPEEMVLSASRLGLKWLGISDHSRSARFANGLDLDRLMDQWETIDAVNSSSPPVRLLKGIECEILADGGLDYPDHILAKFDFVIAAVHTHFTMPREEATRRVLKALENPFVDVLAHPEGRLLLNRESLDMDYDEVFRTCAARGIAIEINSQPLRLDADWRRIRSLGEAGPMFVITPDAHTPPDIANIRYGLGIARKGGLPAASLLNSLSEGKFLEHIRKRRKR